MSEAHDIMADVVDDRASYTTDAVTHLRTGQPIIAEIDGTPDAVTVATELGDDYRNVVLLHVNDDSQAALLRSQDRVSFTLFGRQATAVIIRRRDNPANVQTDFWAQVLAAGKDNV